jgi:hypothetical protein
MCLYLLDGRQIMAHLGVRCLPKILKIEGVSSCQNTSTSTENLFHQV